MKKRFEILILKLVAWLIQSRDVNRSSWISRYDNKDLWGMSERIEHIISRMETDYSQKGA